MNISSTTSNRQRKWTKQNLIPSNNSIENDEKDLYSKIKQKIRRVLIFLKYIDMSDNKK